MPRILVVDDDEALRNLLQEILTDAGYEVQCACDGRAALKLYFQQTPDLVVIDLIMPTQRAWKLFCKCVGQIQRLKPSPFPGADIFPPKTTLPWRKNAVPSAP